MVQRPASPALDLFGEVPITRREVMLWLWKVPAWMTRHATTRQIEAYVTGYHVVDKIRRAKLAGRLEGIFGDESCPHCGGLLEADLTARIKALEAELAALRAVPPAPTFAPLRLKRKRPATRPALPLHCGLPLLLEAALAVTRRAAALAGLCHRSILRLGCKHPCPASTGGNRASQRAWFPAA